MKASRWPTGIFSRAMPADKSARGRALRGLFGMLAILMLALVASRPVLAADSEPPALLLAERYRELTKNGMPRFRGICGCVTGFDPAQGADAPHQRCSGGVC